MTLMSIDTETVIFGYNGIMEYHAAVKKNELINEKIFIHLETCALYIIRCDKQVAG